MKITLVTGYFPPESNAPAVRSWEHAREWVRMGHDVEVLTGLPNHPDGVVPPEYRGRPWRRETREGVRVLRSWVWAAPNRGTVRRSLSYASFMAGSFVVGGLLGRRPDVVAATSPHFLSGVSGWALARVRRVPFVLELRDIWPESAQELGALESRAALAPLFRLQGSLYGDAVRVVTVSRAFREHLERSGVPDRRIAYVPNGIDPGFLSDGEVEARVEPLRRELGLEGAFVVSYVGTHGMAHGLDRVLDAAALMADDPGVRFVFAGSGAERPALEERVRREGLSGVSVLGQRPRRDAGALYRISDVCLVPLRDLPIFRKVLPSKLFEIMGAGTPVVCSVPEGEATDLVRRSGGGLVVPPEDPEALARAVRRLRSEPEARRRMGRKGREFVMREHLRPELARRMAAVLEEAVTEYRGG